CAAGDKDAQGLGARVSGRTIAQRRGADMRGERSFRHPEAPAIEIYGRAPDLADEAFCQTLGEVIAKARVEPACDLLARFLGCSGNGVHEPDNTPDVVGLLRNANRGPPLVYLHDLTNGQLIAERNVVDDVGA